MLTFHETAYSLEQGVFHNTGEHFAPPTIPFSQSHESHTQVASVGFPARIKYRCDI